MKIICFHYSNALGGAERSLLDLLGGLSKEKYEIVLITFGSGRLSLAAKSLGVRVISLPEASYLATFRRGLLFFRGWMAMFYLPALIKQVLRIRAVLCQEQAAVIYTHNPKSHILGALASLFLPVRALFHIRDIFPRCSFASLTLSLASAMKNSRNVCISRVVMDALPGFMQKRSQIIYNGFLPPTIQKKREQVRIELGIGYNEKLIVSSGRIVPWKGFDLLINALAPILRGGGCKLVVLGEPMYWGNGFFNSLKRLVKDLGVENEVVWTGFVDNPQDIYAASDLFILASRKEPFGRVLVEVMQCGVPVIAFDEAGPREIVDSDKTGYLVEPGSESSLREAALLLLTDGQKAKFLGKAAQEAVARRFPLSNTLSALDKIFQEIHHGVPTK